MGSSLLVGGGLCGSLGLCGASRQLTSRSLLASPFLSQRLLTSPCLGRFGSLSACPTCLRLSGSSLASLLFQAFLTCLCLSDTPRILLGGPLGLSLFARNLSRPSFGSLSRGGLTLGLGGGTLTHLLHLNLDQSVDLGVQNGVLLMLLGYDSLNGFLLFLQSLDNLLLLVLVALEFFLLLFTLIKEVVLLASHILQLRVFLRHLVLFGPNRLTLRPLILGIFAHEAQTPIHLSKVLCGEDEHQSVLHRAMSSHVSHRLHISCLSVFQLQLQRGELRFQDADVAFDMLNVRLDVVDVLLPLVDLTIDGHQVLQTLGHILLVGLQRLLLFSDLLLNGRALVLQSTDRRIGVTRRVVLLFSRRGLLRLRLLFYRLRLLANRLRPLSLHRCGARLLAGRIRFLGLRPGNHHQGQAQHDAQKSSHSIFLQAAKITLLRLIPSGLTSPTAYRGYLGPQPSYICSTPRYWSPSRRKSSGRLTPV